MSVCTGEILRLRDISRKRQRDGLWVSDDEFETIHNYLERKGQGII
jgi:hypothetical protein